jgi:hypothetical protein
MALIVGAQRPLTWSQQRVARAFVIADIKPLVDSPSCSVRAGTRRLQQAQCACSAACTAAVQAAEQAHCAHEALELDMLADELSIDTLARLGAHPPGGMRGLVAAESCRSAALVTVPVGSSLALQTAGGPGGEVTVLGPAEVPRNVAKALEGRHMRMHGAREGEVAGFGAGFGDAYRRGPSGGVFARDCPRACRLLPM